MELCMFVHFLQNEFPHILENALLEIILYLQHEGSLLHFSSEEKICGVGLVVVVHSTVHPDHQASSPALLSVGEVCMVQCNSKTWQREMHRCVAFWVRHYNPNAMMPATKSVQRLTTMFTETDGSHFED
jgi:hypothetical protein